MTHFKIDGEKLKVDFGRDSYSFSVISDNSLRAQVKKERRSAQRLSAAFGILTTMNGIGPEAKK